MKTSQAYFVACIFAAVSFISCSSKDNPSTPTNPLVTASDTNTLSVLKLASDADAPDYNSSSVESIWNSATALTTTASAIGDNFTGNPFPVTIKSVVSSQNIYFLVQYNDTAPNYFTQPLHFHGGDPNASSNWSIDGTTYEDGLSLIFEDPAHQGTTRSKTFSSDGCAMLCHNISTSQWMKGMFAENDGRYDLWYWHAGKGNGSGYADDEISIGDPNFGIIKDDDNAEIYHYNVISDNMGYLPYYVAGQTNRGLDKQYFIAEETAQLFGSNTTVNPQTIKSWAANDIVPAYTLALPTDPSNDYFDVHAKGYWSNGMWIVKFQRKLNTGSSLDTQFASGNEYKFSFAIHNNNSPDNHYGVANKSFTLKLP